MSEGLAIADLLQEPFMQRALLGGLLTGALGGLLGSFAVLRQLSFFSDALGHSALVGITVGILLGLNPTLVLIPFAVVFALVVNRLVERSALPTDALLNIVYSSSLALAVVALSFVRSYKGGIQHLLFGDILGVSWLDLGLIAALLAVAMGYLALTRRDQILLTLDEPLALSRGVVVPLHRLLFIVLLAVVVAVSIKAVGVLLISAFVVIPACASRLVSDHFNGYVLLASGLGALCAVSGLLLSGMFDLPSGPSVVIVQLLAFLGGLGVSSVRVSVARG
ncbi:metal ABC transporter permease [Cyanobium sp. Morenito 9A2]|uniref:metal ABC transporter permease n=1 Tax=Cyanobium sp. Morenito 9A2 TaxID=2823718 RepID=UPI0020CC6C71|nr:metal ABC transporter permease [Cyanobium sp. Morenito 9A2]MCP9848446.1 metal ABC transporter permease [Cyanobium sp. Morenito 9A2]